MLTGKPGTLDHYLVACLFFLSYILIGIDGNELSIKPVVTITFISDRFVQDINTLRDFHLAFITVYIRAYAEQTVTERTDVYRNTRFFAPKMFCTVFHPKLYASNVLLYRPCMSIYYLPKHLNFRHGSLVV